MDTQTANEPTPIVAQPSWDDNPISRWLLTEGWTLTDPANLVARLCERLIDLGMPMYRLRLTIRTLHPQVVGTSYTWTRGQGEVDTFAVPYEILVTDQYRASPYAAIFEGAGGIRRRLDIPNARLDYPILADLVAEGVTDYVAMPIVFSDGKINAITFAADRPGGFTTAELDTLADMLVVLARIVETQAMRHTARTLMETYLGRQTGGRVLDGLIKRGDGEDIHAVLWFCDLRESTRLSSTLQRTEYLALLNDFFECMAGAVLDHGGEVLRFIGDAVLAIFPIEAKAAIPKHCPEHHGACRRAVGAARDARGRVAALNANRAEAGQAPLRFGIGLHLGDVTYGNIGVPARLEFSVIGAAANEAARIESLCKELGYSILVSEVIAQIIPDEALVSCGRHELRGRGGDMEIFTLAPSTDALEADKVA